MKKFDGNGPGFEEWSAWSEVPAGAWDLFTAADGENQTSGAGNYAAVRSFSGEFIDTWVTVTSPGIDAINYQGLTLSFDYHFHGRGWPGDELYSGVCEDFVSFWVGGTQVGAIGLSDDFSDMLLSGTKIYDISFADGDLNLELCFRFYSSMGAPNYGTIDNVRIKGTPAPSPDNVTNSLGMSFNLIPAGTFMMGSTDESNEQPVHEVTLTQPFYMMTTEVTQGQWEAVMGNNPSVFSACGADCPVENVPWDDIQEFITAINAIGEGSYFLPTEAQWEYACRAGSTADFASGDMSESGCNLDPNLNAMGWYCYNAGSTTHPVAQKQANSWGLYDMHGNLREWCSDWYGSYLPEPSADPEGPTSGTERAIRSGSWLNGTLDCRSAWRIKDTPADRHNTVGFRLARFPDKAFPNSGLVSYYSLDEVSGGVTDSYGSDDGVNHGATQGAVGRIGNAYDFENDELDYVTTPLIPTNTFSISFWTKIESFDGNQTFGTIENASGGKDGYAAGITPTYLNCTYYKNNVLTADLSYSQTLNIDQWYHIVYTVDESLSLSVFVDGEFENSTTLSSVPDSHDMGLMIGNGAENQDYNRWDGLLDEVGIWNRALTSDEIANLYNNGNGLPYE